MNLSIVIVNWHSAGYLRECLASVYRFTRGIQFEVIVVDNSPGDDTCARLVRNEYPQVLLHCSEKNLGFARACNLGAALSSGDILLFLNPDTEVRDDVFARMVTYLSNSRIGAVGPRLLNSDGSVQTSCVQAYPTISNQLLDSELLRRIFPKSRLWGMAALFGLAEDSRVDAVSGACLMVKRDVFQQVGSFDNKYFMYVEDLDLCLRITRAGFSVHCINHCEVIHHGGKSSAQQNGCFANLRQQQAVLQLFCATKGAWYGYVYRCTLATAALLRILLLAALIPIYLRSGTTSLASRFEKWSSIFRWAIGLHSS